MTDTITRPRPRPRSPGAPVRRAARPGLLRAGLPAAGWAAVAGLVAIAVPVLLLWAADSRSGAGAGDALRTVASIWLLAHGAVLDVPGGTVGLTPLGLLALPLLLLERAARHAASEHEVATLGEGARLAAGVAGPYALVVAVLAGLTAGGGVRPAVTQALVGASLLGLVGAGTGVLRARGMGGRLWSRVPGRLQRAAAPATAGLVGLLGAGGLLVAGMLLLHLGRARELAGATAPGVVGGLGLLLLGLLLAPGAVVWGTAFLAGPGFAVGVGTAVGPFGVALGPVPSVPLLAALPGGPLPAYAAVLLLLGPVLCGVLVGSVARRRGAGLLDALLAAPLAGVAVAGLAWLSSGALGTGRLRELGPSWWQVGLAVTGELAVGVLLRAGATRLRPLLPARPTLPRLRRRPA